MNLKKVLLWVGGVSFIGFGLAFMFAPAQLAAAFTGSSPVSTSALIDMRATYGGLNLAVGMWMLYSLRDPGLHNSGLLGLALVAAGLAVGRLYGILVDGSANQYMYIFLAIEIATAGLALLTLRQPNAA